MKKGILIISSAIIFIVVFFISTALYNEKQTEEKTNASAGKSEHLIQDYSPRTGPDDAKVTIVEFFDPACGTCSAFYPLVKQIMADHPGKVNLVLRYLPLHQNSDVIVSIFEAARLQNKFWETLEHAYKTRDHWIEHHVAKPEDFWKLLGVLELDMEKLYQDLQSEEIARRVKQDFSDAQALGVRKTPGFFVNGKPLVQFGHKPLQQLVGSEVRANY